MLEILDFLNKLPPWTLIGLILVFIIISQALIRAMEWSFKEFWANRKSQLEKHDKALLENTIAIIKLQSQIEKLSDLLVIVPKLKEDVYHAHEKIRQLENS